MLKKNVGPDTKRTEVAVPVLLCVFSYAFYSVIKAYGSKIYYSLYLVHIPAVILNAELLKGAGDTGGFTASLGKYLLIISTTFVTSSLICRYFELPVMKLRDKKVKSN